jgi:hypothetical protein
MSISNADIDNLLSLINKGDIESLKSEDFDQFQYQGFDPIQIVRALLKVKNNEKLDDDMFRKDVYVMVAIGMIKGSVTDKNLGKMSDKGKSDVEKIMKMYGIVKGGGRGQPAGTITFPRVMATFPDIAVRMVSVLGAKDFRGGPMLSSRLPGYLKVSVFPAVIPRDLDASAKRMLLTANLCYSIDQSVQISELKDYDLKQLAATQANFTMIGHQSPVPKLEVRKSVFASLPVSSDYEVIASVLKDYKRDVDPSFDIMEEKAFLSALK